MITLRSLRQAPRCIFNRICNRQIHIAGAILRNPLQHTQTVCSMPRVSASRHAAIHRLHQISCVVNTSLKAARCSSSASAGQRDSPKICVDKVDDAVLTSMRHRVCFVTEEALDAVIQNTFPEIAPQVKAANFKANASKVLTLFHGVDDQDLVNLIVLIGLGKGERLNRNGFVKAIKAAYDELKERDVRSFAVEGLDFRSSKSAFTGIANPRVLVETLLYADYNFDFFKKDEIPSGKGNTPYRLEEIRLQQSMNVQSDGGDTDSKFAEFQISFAHRMANAQNYTRTLQYLPANVCTTDYMVAEGRKLADESKGRLKFTCIGMDDMLRMGMGCISAVGKGSAMPPYICALEWIPGGKANEFPGEHDSSLNDDTVVLVGKGVVHDSGGLCIKPGAAMIGMKMDMSGAASVWGVMKFLSNPESDVFLQGTSTRRIIGLVGLVENSISGTAYRPGDVLTSMQGTTVEVGNTDAEGRLVLCDALTYLGEEILGIQGMRKGDKIEKDPQSKMKPIVIDIATLTGAMITALGDDLTGAFANDPNLLDELQVAGEESGDRIWKMPLKEVQDQYESLLESKVADTNNIGGAPAGSITAALFLSKFTGNYRWTHLDVAGTAMGAKMDTATGRPVPLLLEFLAKHGKSQ